MRSWLNRLQSIRDFAARVAVATILRSKLKSMITGRCCFRKNIEISSPTIKLRAYHPLGVFNSSHALLISV